MGSRRKATPEWEELSRDYLLETFGEDACAFLGLDDEMPELDVDTDGLLLPRKCALYFPGHTVHYIQARLAIEDEQRTPPRIGEVVSTLGALITVDFGETVERYRNHEVPRLRQVLERFGSEVLVQTGRSLLRVPEDPGSHFCFSIAPASAEHRRCV